MTFRRGYLHEILEMKDKETSLPILLGDKLVGYKSDAKLRTCSENRCKATHSVIGDCGQVDTDRPRISVESLKQEANCSTTTIAYMPNAGLAAYESWTPTLKILRALKVRGGAISHHFHICTISKEGRLPERFLVWRSTEE
jgi:hypothetical protein